MSFNHKLRSPSSPCLLFCCFHDGHDGHAAAAAHHEAASSSDDCNDGNRCEAVRSPCSIRCECWSLVARIGRCRRQGHVAASEFGYGPMSYVLNFEDDRSRESDGELDKDFPAKNFSARLPAPPDRLLPGKLPTEVVACS